MNRHARVEDLSTYLDDELAPAERRRIEGHLRQCPRCKEQLDGMRRVVAGLEAMSRVAPLPYLEQEVRRSVSRRERSGQPLTEAGRGVGRWLLRPNWVPVFGTVMALAVIVYLFSWGLYRHEQRGIPVILQSESEAIAEPEVGIGGAPLEGEDGRSASRAAAPPESADHAAAVSMEDAMSPSVEVYREVRGRAFVLRNGIWVETGLEESPADERLDAASEGAGALLGQFPELQQISELGGTVRLRLGDQIVEVTFP